MTRAEPSAWRKSVPATSRWLIARAGIATAIRRKTAPPADHREHRGQCRRVEQDRNQGRDRQQSGRDSRDRQRLEPLACLEQRVAQSRLDRRQQDHAAKHDRPAEPARREQPARQRPREDNREGQRGNGRRQRQPPPQQHDRARFRRIARLEPRDEIDHRIRQLQTDDRRKQADRREQQAVTSVIVDIDRARDQHGLGERGDAFDQR